MGLLGSAVMTGWFDVAPEARSEYDDWLSHEHMPERLAIPGFRRGTRWISLSGSPRNFVMYEVDTFDTLTSEPYLERLNNPTAWSKKIMGHIRNMTRSLCRVTGSFGGGVGETLLTIRLSPMSADEGALRKWLTQSILPGLPTTPGIVGTHLLEAQKQSGQALTQEEKLRGGDAPADWVLLAQGNDSDSMMSLAKDELRAEVLEEHGALREQVTGLYSLAYMLGSQDIRRNG